MRLTKADREMFVDGVMDDVPNIDYDKLAAELVRDTLLSVAPKAVKELYKTHPSWLHGFNIHTPDGLQMIYTKLRVPEAGGNDFAVRWPQQWAQLTEWGKLNQQQREATKALRVKLNATIAGYTTLKAATEGLPEFAKYLPRDRDVVKDRSVPAVANVVTDLMNAGWPKEESNATD